jgi:hypothetical protein
MRRFVRISAGKAVDPESQIRCFSTGQVTPFEEFQSYIAPFDFEAQDRTLTWALAYKPFRARDRIEGGVRIKLAELGRRFGTVDQGDLKAMLNCRPKVEFAGTDLEFLKYLAGGIAAAEPDSAPYRAIIVASEENMRRADIIVPYDVEIVDDSMVVLFESQDEYVK